LKKGGDSPLPSRDVSNHVDLLGSAQPCAFRCSVIISLRRRSARKGASPGLVRIRGSGDHTRLGGYDVVSPGNRNACHAEAFQPLADPGAEEPHATIARRPDQWRIRPQLARRHCPDRDRNRQQFGRLGRVPEKKTQPSDMGRAARPSARGGFVAGSVPPWQTAIDEIRRRMLKPRAAQC
jgi:hypothetical protein